MRACCNAPLLQLKQSRVHARGPNRKDDLLGLAHGRALVTALAVRAARWCVFGLLQNNVSVSVGSVFCSKRSAICAQAVCFLHSTMPSVTCLNSRWWLAACDWVMSALSTVLLIYSFQFRPAFLPRQSKASRHSGVVRLPNIGRRTSREIWGCYLYEVYIQGNYFELVPTVKWKLDIP